MPAGIPVPEAGNLIFSIELSLDRTQHNIRNHPALAGFDVSRLGAYGRIFFGVLATGTLVNAGEGDVHANAGGELIADALP